MTAPAQQLISLRRRIRRTPYLRKWILLGGLIGIISGAGAALFFRSLELAAHLFMGLIAGYTPATPLAEGAAPITDALRPWALPITVALGGLISGIIVFRLAPEAEGHGTDAAIAAFHRGARRIRGRIPAVKLIASAITIGSGGSGGREGPTAQIGAGFGSFLGRLLDLDARDARIAVASGIAAGIGAIFRAPLGGAILGAEIPYRDDVESEALVPSFVASVVAFTVFGAFVGFDPIFGAQTGAGFDTPVQLVWYALIGLVAGIVGRLYIRGFYGATDWFASWKRIPRDFRPAIGGFIVGLMGMALPGVLGTGYGWVQAGLDRSTLLSLPLIVVLALPFARILATGLSIGSGGSGGIFGPGMVIGGLLGAGVWRLLEPVAPAIPASPAPFVIVAMMALFGSVAHAPLAVMLMVAEMTDNLAMLAPAMLAVGIATLIVGDLTIYRSQLRSRTESPAHRFRFALPLMASIPAGDAARAARVVLEPDERVAAAIGRLEAADVEGAPVVDRNGAVRAVVDLADLRRADPDAAVSAVANQHGPEIRTDDGLDDAVGTLADHRASWAPVVAEGKLVGILSARDAMTAYRRALAGNVRQVRGVGGEGVLLTAVLSDGSPLVGHAVSDAPWPRDTVLVAIDRGGELVVPRGPVQLVAGDSVTILTAPASEEKARQLLEPVAVRDEITEAHEPATPPPGQGPDGEPLIAAGPGGGGPDAAGPGTDQAGA
jgi:CIC family chloride channel protein